MFSRSGRRNQGSEKLLRISKSAQAGQANTECQGEHGGKLWGKAGVSYFPIYNLRHVFCTRLSWVAPDAVVQRGDAAQQSRDEAPLSTGNG